MQTEHTFHNYYQEDEETTQDNSALVTPDPESYHDYNTAMAPTDMGCAAAAAYSY